MAVKARDDITLVSVYDGEKGDTGNQGTSIDAYYRFYKLAASTPAAPTTNPSSVPSGWTDTEPVYTSGSTDSLYFVDATLFENETFTYSAVSKSTAYEAAKEAYTAANNAQASADNAQQKADSNAESLAETIASLQVLSNSISSLVKDGNGSSLMVQNPDGVTWSFSTESLQQAINTAIENINTIEGDLSAANNVVNGLNTMITGEGGLVDKTAYIHMGKDDDGNPCIELGKEGGDFKVRITDTAVDFFEGTAKVAYINNQSLYVEKAVIKEQLQIGEPEGFVLRVRSNGNVGLIWVGSGE